MIKKRERVTAGMLARMLGKKRLGRVEIIFVNTKTRKIMALSAVGFPGPLYPGKARVRMFLRQTTERFEP